MLTHIKRPAALVLLLTTAACTSLQPVMEPTGFIADKNPKFVVITTADAEDETLVLSGPRLQSGSLTGTFEGETVTYPMGRIRTVMAVQPDKKRTLFAILGLAVGVGAVTYMMVGNGKDINRSPICVPEGHRGDLPYCE